MEAICWLIALIALLAIEIATLGLTTIWFAGGSLVAFVAALLHAPIVVQVVLFLVVSFVLLIFTRPIAIRYLNKDREKTNYEGIIGREGKVTERIDNFNQTGTVIVAGQEWSARAAQDGQIIEPDSRVVVKRIEGVKVFVDPVEVE